MDTSTISTPESIESIMRFCCYVARRSTGKSVSSSFKVLACSGISNSQTHALRIPLRRRECSECIAIREVTSRIKVGIPAAITVSWILFIAKQRPPSSILPSRAYCLAESTRETARRCVRGDACIAPMAFDRKSSKHGMRYDAILKHAEYRGRFTANGPFTLVAFAAMQICDKCKMFRAFSYTYFFSFLFFPVIFFFFFVFV